MTKQEMFNKAVGGIIAQGGPALAEGGGMCMYRTPNGRMCAAGQLIPDERYDPAIEGFGSYNELVLDCLGIDHENDDLINFVGTLQSAHDSATTSDVPFMERFKLLARGVAERHNLNTEVLDNG